MRSLQDDLIVIEALTRLSYQLDESGRSDRAWQLADDLLAKHELTLLEATMAMDEPIPDE